MAEPRPSNERSDNPGRLGPQFLKGLLRSRLRPFSFVVSNSLVSTVSNSKISTLLRLLSDPSEHVAKTIQEELITLGPSALPHLQEARETHEDLDSRISYVCDEIFFSELHKDFHTFVGHCSRHRDWEQGAFLIARLGYPDLDLSHYGQCLDHLAEEFRSKWHSSTSPPHKAAESLKTFLFKDKGFSGNRIHYYDPDNSFLNRVIECRQGIPITLSAIYVLVGARLDLPLVGVGMPGHFLVRVEGSTPTQFVDCFNGGALLHEEDCQQFLTASGIDFQPNFLEKSPVKLILARMLRNLFSIYEEGQEHHMARRVETLLKVLEEPTS